MVIGTVPWAGAPEQHKGGESQLKVSEQGCIEQPHSKAGPEPHTAQVSLYTSLGNSTGRGWVVHAA